MKEVITLDNSRINIDDALMQDLIKGETYDINSILLVADAFITARHSGNPHSTGEYKKCAEENEKCACKVGGKIAYGAPHW